MPIYNISNKVKKIKYKNKDIKLVYYGNNLVFRSSIYNPGEIVYYNKTPGVYEFTVGQTSVYDIILVGGGGGFACGYKNEMVTKNTQSGGGGCASGMCMRMKLYKNIVYFGALGSVGIDRYGKGSYTAGDGEDSNFLECCIVYGGKGGGAGPGSYGEWGGAGGNYGTIDLDVLSTYQLEYINTQWNNPGAAGSTYDTYSSHAYNPTTFHAGPYTSESNCGAGRNYFNLSTTELGYPLCKVIFVE